MPTAGPPCSLTSTGASTTRARGPLGEGATVRTGSVGDFFEQALTFFGEQPEDLGKPGKGARLAGLVRRQRTLLILDGLEPLQHPIGGPLAGRLLDPDLRDLILGSGPIQPRPLRAEQSPGPRRPRRPGRTRCAAGRPQRPAEDSRREPAAPAPDRGHGQGAGGRLREFGCHALSLTLLGRFLFDAHGGDIRRIDRIRDLEKADRLTREERHRTAWKVLEAYEEWLSRARADGNPATLAVLRLTGLFDRVATADCLDALRADPVIPGLTEAVHAMDRDEWNILLRRLERAHLIKLRVAADDGEALAIDAHPLVREYFARQLREKRPEAFRAAHSRLFDHLCGPRRIGPTPSPASSPFTRPSPTAAWPGDSRRRAKRSIATASCAAQATMASTASSKLGAIGADLGAVAAFFDEPWRRLAPNLSAPDQAWLLSLAAFRLRPWDASPKPSSRCEGGWSGASERSWGACRHQRRQSQWAGGDAGPAERGGGRRPPRHRLRRPKRGLPFRRWLAHHRSLRPASGRGAGGRRRTVRRGGADAGGQSAAVPAAHFVAGLPVCRFATGHR